MKAIITVKEIYPKQTKTGKQYIKLLADNRKYYNYFGKQTSISQSIVKGSVLEIEFEVQDKYNNITKFISIDPNASPKVQAPNTSSDRSPKMQNPIPTGATGKVQPEPQPLNTNDICDLYDKAKMMLEARGFEASNDLLAIALKIELERHIERFWLEYTKWDFSLKEQNRRAWKEGK